MIQPPTNNQQPITENREQKIPRLNLTWHDTGKNQVYCSLVKGKILLSYCQAWCRSHYRLTVYLCGKACYVRNCATEEIARQTAEEILIMFFDAIEDVFKF